MALKSRVQSLEHAATVTKCEHSTSEIREFIAALDNGTKSPYPFLGAGIAKSAYALPCGKHVAKVSSSRESQTRDELRLWVSADAKLRRILAPIRAYGVIGSRAVLIVDRAETLQNWTQYELPQKFQRMKKTAYGYGIGDLHPGNVGIIRGRCVVIDYGFCEGNGSDYDSDPSELREDSDAERFCPDCGDAFQCCADDHECQLPTPSPIVRDSWSRKDALDRSCRVAGCGCRK